VKATGAEEPDQSDDDQINGDDIVQQPGTIRIRIPAISDTRGVRPKVIFIEASFLSVLL